MSFSQDAGYLPQTIPALMDIIMANVNAQFGTTYTTSTFLGTNFYKYFYALIQRLQANEVKTSEIFLRMQEYFVITNEQIQRPNTTHPGLVQYLADRGFQASTKKPIDADAGKLYVCVNVDDGTHATGNVTITSYANLVSGTPDTVTVGATVFTAQSGAASLGSAVFQAATSNAATATSLAAQINAHAVASTLVWARASGAIVYIIAISGGTAGNAIALGYTDNDTNIGATKSGTVLSGGVASTTFAAKKLAINTAIKDCAVAGVVTQGLQVSTITLPNNQSFDFKFSLPNKTPITLRLTITLSANNQFTVPSDVDVTALLFANINARYKMGLDFEPQKYFSTADAPWASKVLLEYDKGAGMVSTVFSAAYNDLLTFAITDITIVDV